MQIGMNYIKSHVCQTKGGKKKSIKIYFILVYIKMYNIKRSRGGSADQSTHSLNTKKTQQHPLKNLQLQLDTQNNSINTNVLVSHQSVTVSEHMRMPKIQTMQVACQATCKKQTECSQPMQYFLVFQFSAWKLPIKL